MLILHKYGEICPSKFPHLFLCHKKHIELSCRNSFVKSTKTGENYRTGEEIIHIFFIFFCSFLFTHCMAAGVIRRVDLEVKVIFHYPHLSLQRQEEKKREHFQYNVKFLFFFLNAEKGKFPHFL